jgi:hypothetical protein
MQVHEPQTGGVYPYLTNSAAFVDKVVVSVRGLRRKKSKTGIAEEQNLAVGGPGSFYARCIRGKSTLSGNPLQCKYGVMRRYGNLSPFVVTVRADRVPISCADVLLVLDGFMRAGYKAKVSAVEMTFDTRDIPLARFTRDLCTRARLFKEFDGDQGSTVYVGGANSPWQLRIYQKTFSVVRIEFILRSTFLRSHNIFAVQDVYRLRKTKLWNYVSFREVDQSQGDFLPPRVSVPWKKLGHGLPPDMPTSIVLQGLRDAQVDPHRWIVRSQREILLRNMQTKFIW